MKKLKDDVRDQILRSTHVEDGNRKLVAGEPADGYMAELKIRAIGHFKTPDEARYHLLKQMTGVINDLFDGDT